MKKKLLLMPNTTAQEFTCLNKEENRNKHPERNPNSMRNSFYHHPSSVYNLTNICATNERGVRTPTQAHAFKDEKRASKKRRQERNKKSRPRHFHPVLRIKFFNPEKLRFSACANTRRIFEYEIKTVVLCLSLEDAMERLERGMVNDDCDAKSSGDGALESYYAKYCNLQTNESGSDMNGTRRWRIL
jgi:hypothetical protein